MLRRLALAVLLVAVGCNRGPNLGAKYASRFCEDISTAQAPEGATTCRVLVDMSIRATGAEDIDLSGRLSLVTTDFYKGKLPQEAWFANLGTEVPQEIPQPSPFKMLVQLSFDIAPGTYRGAGTYELTPKGAKVEGIPESPVTNAAKLTVTSVTKERLGAFVYEQLLEPCTATFTRRVEKGTLTCPKLGLTDDASKTVKLDARWTPVPAPKRG